MDSKKTALRRMKRDDGQGMTEYIIIVALIAIAAIGVVTVFGQNIRAIFGATTSSLAGNTAVTSNATAAGVQANKKSTLKTFGQSNQGN